VEQVGLAEEMVMAGACVCGQHMLLTRIQKLISKGGLQATWLLQSLQMLGCGIDTTHHGILLSASTITSTAMPHGDSAF
jgi:hypothetical protein